MSSTPLPLVQRELRSPHGKIGTALVRVRLHSGSSATGPSPSSRMRVRSIPENAVVVGLGVEDADVGALGIELAQPHQLPTGIDGVRAAHRERVGRDRHGVLADRAQVEHQPEAGRAGRIAHRLKQPELQEVVVAEVDARWGSAR